MLQRLLIAVLICIVVGAACAQQACEPTTSEYRIVYANGALTTVAGATVARRELREAVGETYQSRRIGYDIVYNYTSQAFEDLKIGLDQQLRTYNSQTLLWLHGAGRAPDWFTTIQQRLLATAYPVEDRDLIAQLEKAREGIAQGQKLLVVAHGQGNLYANRVRQLLAGVRPAIPLGDFGIFAVATPAGNVGGSSSPYLTNHRDAILLTPGSLAANWTLRDASTHLAADTRGRLISHSLVDTYLSPAFDARAALVSGIKLRLSALQESPQTGGSDVINAFMSWNLDNSDVDLHVREPGNHHVYYMDPRGSVGNIDIANQVGYGPEHYFVDCAHLRTGEYLFGINYYEDYADDANRNPARPATVNLTVSVPGISRTLTTTLTDDIQTAGDAAPLWLFKVVVERIVDPDPKRNGKLKYRIAQL